MFILSFYQTFIYTSRSRCTILSYHFTKTLYFQSICTILSFLFLSYHFAKLNIVYSRCKWSKVKLLFADYLKNRVPVLRKRILPVQMHNEYQPVLAEFVSCSCHIKGNSLDIVQLKSHRYQDFLVSADAYQY